MTPSIMKRPSDELWFHVILATIGWTIICLAVAGIAFLPSFERSGIEQGTASAAPPPSPPPSAALAVDALEEALVEAQRPERQAEALAVLETRQDPRVTNGLLHILGSRDPALRERAARALGRGGELRTAPYLLARLDDAETAVRDAAAEALEHLASVAGAPAYIGPYRPVTAAGAVAHARLVAKTPALASYAPPAAAAGSDTTSAETPTAAAPELKP